MTIRFAQPRDIPGMIDLLRQVGQVHHEIRPDLFRAGAQKYDAADLAKLLRDENRPIFICEEAGQVLGYGFCILKDIRNDPVLEDHKELYIDDLCVDENYRGKHIGKALYAHIVSYAKAIRCHSVTLNVWAFNESAMGFYRSVGLTPQKVGMEMRLEEV